ncbi:MAG: beta-ketoacyl-ACP synthase II [Planctomycetaceae bacterium]|jgi:3-oxoacyl-[acyl-carrier-protein] synthase II|nr:beta-ketoacyl-ACP synthase II [Planctomycetaceae bacterium]
MRTIQLRRVVVTGMGAISNLGTSAPKTWSAMKDGCSGITPLRTFPQNDDWTVRFAGEIHDFDASSVVDGREQKRIDRVALMAMVAADEAARDSGFDFRSAGDPYRHGTIIGSGIGGVLTMEEGHKKLLETGPRRVSPFVVPRLMVNAAPGNVSIQLNLKGPSTAVASACASSGHAIGIAMQMIQRGDCDVMVAGGSEAAITPLTLSAFASMKALSTRNDAPTKASRPFDRDRDGFVLSEGAAILVLEELEHAKKRGARIYCELVGFGATGDAHHIAAPDEQGSGAFKAMEVALRDAGVHASDVGYINAHGTSTPQGDKAEVTAVKRLFGEHAYRLAMSSTKSMTGHALGAAGGIESVAAIMAIYEGVLAPTINLDNPDEGFDLNFVANVAQERKVDVTLNNTFGFGGHNVSLVFKRFS